jgi:hypothetical protein
MANRPGANSKHSHVVDYHHVIHAPHKKPMALLNLAYRDQLLPHRTYPRAFEALLAIEREKQACRIMGSALPGSARIDRCADQDNRKLILVPTGRLGWTWFTRWSTFRCAPTG